MIIKSLYVNKYKSLIDFFLNFDDKINVFVGQNGVGKTLIMEIIYALFNGNFQFFEDDSDFKVCKCRIKYNEKEITCLRDYFGNEFTITDEISYSKEEGLNVNLAEVFTKAKINSHLLYLPAVSQYIDYKAETVKKIPTINKYALVLATENISVELKDFLVNQDYQDYKDLKSGNKGSRINKFKEVFNTFYSDKELIGVDDFQVQFRINSTGEIHSIDELGSGEKQLFFRCGSLLQYNLKNSLILVDEPENSLHPFWQEKVLNFYKKVCSENQIFMATHSPHIVSSCKKEEVHLITKNNEGRSVVLKNLEGTYGWSVEQLLLTVFGLESVRDIDVQNKINKFKRLYTERQKLSLDERREMNRLKSELQEYLDPDDPSFALIDFEENYKKLKDLIRKLNERKNFY